jgi:hypothetical protein
MPSVSIAAEARSLIPTLRDMRARAFVWFPREPDKPGVSEKTPVGGDWRAPRLVAATLSHCDIGKQKCPLTNLV